MKGTQNPQNKQNPQNLKVSWAHQPVPPVAVDPPRGTIFRIDLRDYAWDDGEDGNTSDLWDTLIENNTYAVLHLNTANALEVVTQTRTPVPVVRGDWFAAKATTAPLYYDLLQIPEELDSLEKDFLLVDPQANIDRLTAVRAGFTPLRDPLNIGPKIGGPGVRHSRPLKRSLRSGIHARNPPKWSATPFIPFREVLSMK